MTGRADPGFDRMKVTIMSAHPSPDRVAKSDEPHDATVPAEHVVTGMVGNQAGQRVAHDGMANAGYVDDPARHFLLVEPEAAFLRRWQVALLAASVKSDGIMNGGNDEGHGAIVLLMMNSRVGGSRVIHYSAGNGRQ